MRLAEASHVNGVEIFTLICLRNHGRELDSKQKAISPPMILHSFFEESFNYSDGDVDLHLGVMEQKGCCCVSDSRLRKNTGTLVPTGEDLQL